MECLMDDIQEHILSFLSLKEKIKATEVCKSFRRNIKSIVIEIPRMNLKIERSCKIVKKQSVEMLMIKPGIYIPRSEANIRTNVHPLYRQHRYNQKEKCIVERCRERRLENIYVRNIPTGDISDEYYYTKQKMGYCIECFSIWGLGVL